MNRRRTRVAAVTVATLGVFLTMTGGSETYTFGVRQTYSDGSVVEWTGNETSDTPSPTIKGVSSIGGGASSTLGIIAIVVAAVELLLAVVSLLSGRRSLT